MSNNASAPNKDILFAYAAFKRELTLISSQRLKEMGFGRSQMVILFRLKEGSAAMGELSELVQSDPAATTRTVAGLREAGWVKSVNDANDRRRTLIELTAKGRKKAAEATEMRDEIESRIESALTEAEQIQLTKLLSKAASSLQEERERSK